MKKAITILAIIAIVAGAVFASDPVNPEIHSVKIKSTVEQVPPQFQMEYSIATSETNFAELTGTTNNETTKNNWGVQSYVDSTAKNVSDISKYNITGIFTAKVITDVKLKATDNQTYTLTWKAEPLTQTTDKKNGVAHVVKASTSSTLTVAGTGAASVEDNTVSALSYNVTSEPGAAETTYGNDLIGTNTVQFGTQNNTAGNLSVFTAIYSADSTAPAAEYEATISLSITCN